MIRCRADIVWRMLLLILAGYAVTAFGDQRTPGVDATTWKAQLGGTKAVDTTRGSQHLIIYSNDADATKLVGIDRVLLGDGYSAAVFDRHSGVLLYESGTGEVDGDTLIDFQRAAKGIYVFTTHTDDPRAEDAVRVPFVQTTVHVRPSGHSTERDRLLLKPEAGGLKQIAHWRDVAIGALKAMLHHPMGDADEEQKYLDALGHIRNMSIHHARGAAKALKEIAPLTDGALSEELQEYRYEIEVIARLTGQSLGKAGHRCD